MAENDIETLAVELEAFLHICPDQDIVFHGDRLLTTLRSTTAAAQIAARNDALDEAAKVAHGYKQRIKEPHDWFIAVDISEAIRSLRSITPERSEETTAEPVAADGELLPCPHCSGPAESYHRPQDHWMSNTDWVCCTNDDCGAQTCMHETKAQAIAAWNHRHPTDSAAKDAEIAAYREALELIAAGALPITTSKAALANRGEAGALAKERSE